MKNTDRKTVFCLAWQFFKQTGYTFSECLKKAWANIKLKAKMKSQIVRFYFLKVDGTIREAWGTICPDIVPPTEHTTNRKPNDTVQVYYDTEKQEYRSFKKFNLVSIESYPWH